MYSNAFNYSEDLALKKDVNNVFQWNELYEAILCFVFLSPNLRQLFRGMLTKKLHHTFHQHGVEIRMLDITRSSISDTGMGTTLNCL